MTAADLHPIDTRLHAHDFVGPSHNGCETWSEERCVRAAKHMLAM